MKIVGCYIIVILIIIMALFLYVDPDIGLIMIESTWFIWVPLAVLALILIWAGSVRENRKTRIDPKQLREEQQRIFEFENTTYPAIKQDCAVPNNAKIISVYGLEQHYAYIDNLAFNIFPLLKKYPPLKFPQSQELIELYKCTSIPLSSIDYFTVSGEIYRENKISGGGSNIGGALIGEALGGTAGAIAGSRLGTEINSYTITHDSRMTVLYYFENEHRNYLIFSYDDFQALKDLIPEKNHEIISEIQKRRLIQQSDIGAETKSMKEQIIELKELVDIGALTQEEFEAKKKQLLGI